MSDGDEEALGVGDRESHRHDVFLSYSSKDKAAADTVCAVLEGQGVRCWMAPRDIIPGEDWAGAIIGAIEETRAMVLIFSSFSNTSPQVKREVERAANHNKPIIPFRIEDVTPSRTLEFFISTPHWLDALTPPLEQHVLVLAKDVSRLLGDVPQGPMTLRAEAAAAQPPEPRTPEPPPPEPQKPESPPPRLPEPEPPKTEHKAPPPPEAAAPPKTPEPTRAIGAPTAPPRAAMVTALATGAFLVIVIAIEVLATGDTAVGAPLVGMPIFMGWLAIGMAMEGWLGATGAIVMMVGQLLMWLATFFVGTAVVEILRHAYTGGRPLDPGEYLIGGLTFFGLQAAGFYALLMLLGRGLAQPAGLRIAAIQSVVLGVAGGALSLLQGLLRVDNEPSAWISIPFMALWLILLANGAYAVTGGSAAPLASAKGRAALQAMQLARRGTPAAASIGWVSAAAAGVVAVIVLLSALEIGTEDRYRPQAEAMPTAAGPGGGPQQRDTREVRSPDDYNNRGADLRDTSPPPDQ